MTTGSEEEREKDRLSVVATIGILIATVAATIAGSLAALSGFHAGDADAHRVAWATYSNELLLSYNQYAADQRQSADARLEDALRSHFLIDLAAKATDPVIAAELRSRGLGGRRGAGGADCFPAAVASPDPAQWCRGLGQPYDCAYEVASAYAGTSLNDNRQERAYIAAVSMLAIGLFLFALSKTLSQASMEKLFLALGALITLIGIGWMTAEPFLAPAPSPSASAIRNYEQGWQLEQQGGRPSSVEALLLRSTSQDPSLADAWQQLGEEELLHRAQHGPGAGCPGSLAALSRAWQFRGAADDLDRLAVAEVICGHPVQALAELRSAHPNSSDVAFGQSLALAQLAAGQTPAALRTLDAAVHGIESRGGSTRGSAFTDYWFDQLLTDVGALDVHRVGQRHVDAFIQRLHHDEALATLADFGLVAPTPANGAAVDLTVTGTDPVIGAPNGMASVALHLDSVNLKDGDIVTVVWHQPVTAEGVRLISLALPAPSVTVVGQPGGPSASCRHYVFPALDYVMPGSYQVEVSLDGVPNPTSVPVTVTGTPVPAFTPASARLHLLSPRRMRPGYSGAAVGGGGTKSGSGSKNCRVRASSPTPNSVHSCSLPSGPVGSESRVACPLTRWRMVCPSLQATTASVN